MASGVRALDAGGPAALTPLPGFARTACGHDGFAVRILGPNLDDITRELEALKVSLVRAQPEDLAAEESARIAREISAIRLQLKRLEADREWVKRVAARATSSDPDLL